MSYIKTINVINLEDNRCLGVRFSLMEKVVLGDMNVDSHTLSYVGGRNYFIREFGDVMGLENPDAAIYKREELSEDDTW